MRGPCRCECSDESDLITVFCLTHFLCRETGSSRSPGPGAGSTQLDTRTGPHFLPTDGTRDPGDERVAADLFRELMDAGRHNHATLSFTLIFEAIRHSSLKNYVINQVKVDPALYFKFHSSLLLVFLESSCIKFTFVKDFNISKIHTNFD